MVKSEKAVEVPVSEEKPKVEKVAKKSEREILVAEGKRVFVEPAANPIPFQPVFPQEVEAVSVNIRALQHGETE